MEPFSLGFLRGGPFFIADFLYIIFEYKQSLLAKMTSSEVLRDLQLLDASGLSVLLEGLEVGFFGLGVVGLLPASGRVDAEAASKQFQV